MSKRKAKAKWKADTKRWQVDVRKGGIRRSFYSTISAADAEKKAAKWDGTPPVKKEKKQPETVVGSEAWAMQMLTPPETVNEAYERWLHNELQCNTSESNWRAVDSRYRNWVKYVIGSLPLDAVRNGHIKKVMDDAFYNRKAPEVLVQRKCTKGEHMSRKALKNLRGDLSALFKYCLEYEWVSFVPVIHIDRRAEAVGKTILQKADLDILFNSERTTIDGQETSDPYIYAYRLQVLTGLRPGELLGLEWADIREDCIKVDRSINALGQVTTGKNRNARRLVPLCSGAKEALLKQWQRTGRKGGKVFEILNGEHYCKRLKRYCEFNGITVVTPYELRHTFISMTKGLPPEMVKDMVGHSESMDTYGVYGHHVDGSEVVMAGMLDNAFAAVSKQSKSTA